MYFIEFVLAVGSKLLNYENRFIGIIIELYCHHINPLVAMVAMVAMVATHLLKQTDKKFDGRQSTKSAE